MTKYYIFILIVSMAMYIMYRLFRRDKTPKKNIKKTSYTDEWQKLYESYRK